MVKTKKIVKASLAALLVTSAIVPVASANAPATVGTDITDVVIQLENGTFVKMSLNEYGTYLQFDAIKNTNVTHVIDNAGNIYSLNEYGTYLVVLDGDREEALSTLAEENKAVDINVEQGKVNEDGTVIADGDTPEENAIETFFYNLAA